MQALKALVFPLTCSFYIPISSSHHTFVIPPLANTLGTTYIGQFYQTAHFWMREETGERQVTHAYFSHDGKRHTNPIRSAA